VKYETRIISMMLAPEGESVFCESGIIVGIDDDSGGEYLTISQEGYAGTNKIKIDKIEWPYLRALVNKMFKECRD